MKILTVLKSGGEYTEEHVLKLYKMLEKTNPGLTSQFICLTDMEFQVDTDPVISTVALTDNLPGWWSKMELFKHSGPCLYLDLDTIITNDVIPLIEAAKGHEFVMLRDFYRGERDENAFGSGLMYWEGDLTEIYEFFQDQKENIANAQKMGMYPGDQNVLEDYMCGKITAWQDITDLVSSFKVDIVPKEKAGEKDVVICFHGNPRPWEQYLIPY